MGNRSPVVTSKYSLVVSFADSVGLALPEGERRQVTFHRGLVDKVAFAVFSTNLPKSPRQICSGLLETEFGGDGLVNQSRSTPL